MTNQWFRLYSDFRNDPKVRTMSDTMQIRLVRLFCLRCESPTEVLTEEEIAFGLGIELFRETLHETLHETKAMLHETKRLFLSKKFIDENWAITNWSKRQFASDSSTERVRKHRLNKRLALDSDNDRNLVAGNVSRNVSVTEVKRPRTEQNREEQKQVQPPAPTASVGVGIPQTPIGANRISDLANGVGGGAAQAAGRQESVSKAKHGVLVPLAPRNGSSDRDVSKSSTRGVAANGTGGNSEENGAIRPSKTDSRKEEAKSEVLAYMLGIDLQHLEYIWQPADDKALDALLRAEKDLTIDEFREWLRSRAQSEVNHADPPRLWLRNLRSFKDGSLDRFKHVKVAARYM